MFDYDKLFEEIERKGIKYKTVAEAIGIKPNTLSMKKKNNEATTRELTGTQIAIICEMLRSPMDMFVLKEKPHDTHN